MKKPSIPAALAELGPDGVGVEVGLHADGGISDGGDVVAPERIDEIGVVTKPLTPCGRLPGIGVHLPAAQLAVVGARITHAVEIGIDLLAVLGREGQDAAKRGQQKQTEKFHTKEIGKRGIPGPLRTRRIPENNNGYSLGSLTAKVKTRALALAPTFSLMETSFSKPTREAPAEEPEAVLNAMVAPISSSLPLMLVD